MKKFLVINSAKNIERSFFDLLADLGAENYFFVWAAENSAETIPNGKTEKKSFPPEPNGFFSFLFFIFSLPFFWPKYFFALSALKRRENIEKIICVDEREKIIFTPLAKFLKIKIIWVALPGEPENKLKRLLKISAKSAVAITFTASETENLLQGGCRPENIHNISLGLNLKTAERQENIFSSLAKADKPYSFYKNFTVGVICQDNDRRRLEILLQAVKKCLNLIPNFRLVVLGQDPSNDNLNWLIKNLGLTGRVWLLGEEKDLAQWFKDLDLYIALAENPGLNDLEKTIAAASCGVPLLGWTEKKLSAIISEGQNGCLLAETGAEAIAQKIIAMEADERLRRIMGINGQKMVRDNFDRKKQIERLGEILS